MFKEFIEEGKSDEASRLIERELVALVREIKQLIGDGFGGDETTKRQAILIGHLSSLVILNIAASTRDKRIVRLARTILSSS